MGPRVIPRGVKRSTDTPGNTISGMFSTELMMTDDVTLSASLLQSAPAVTERDTVIENLLLTRELPVPMSSGADILTLSNSAELSTDHVPVLSELQTTNIPVSAMLDPINVSGITVADVTQHSSSSASDLQADQIHPAKPPSSTAAQALSDADVWDTIDPLQIFATPTESIESCPLDQLRLPKRLSPLSKGKCSNQDPATLNKNENADDRKRHQVADNAKRHSRHESPVHHYASRGIRHRSPHEKFRRHDDRNRHHDEFHRSDAGVVRLSLDEYHALKAGRGSTWSRR